jgi:hypothetical protein
MSVANLRGESRDLTWQPPDGVPPNPLEDACIKRINFKSDWKVFAIYQAGARLGTWGRHEQSRHTPDPFAGPWNHWPVGLNPSDGRYAVSNDRVTHAALGGAAHTGELILYGFTRQPVGALAPLARSWNHPPAVDAVDGGVSHGYDRSQRAYQLAAAGDSLAFTLLGSRDTPVVNPCFAIADWPGDADCRLRVDGREVPPGTTFRRGIVRDTDGKPVTVVFLKLESTDDLRIELTARL